MLRISTTTLEQYRKYLFEEQGYKYGNAYTLVTEERLIKAIKREEPESDAMRRGTAFHEMVENAHKYELQVNENPEIVKVNGFYFNREVLRRAKRIIDYDFPFEVKREKVYQLDEDVMIVAKVDQWQGYTVNEHKTKWADVYVGDDKELHLYSPFDVNEYYKSVQWKCYLDIFEADTVQYKVFEVAEYAMPWHDYKQIILINDHVFSFKNYEYLGADISWLINSFAQFIHDRKLEEYFPMKH